MTRPPVDQAAAIAAAFEHLNKEVFDGKLSMPMLTFTRRQLSTLGYYTPAAWSDGGEKRLAEISLNANAYNLVDAWEMYGCLAHEMLHHAQHEDAATWGDPGREGYHTKAFMDRAQALGFTVEGKGQRVATTPAEGKIWGALQTMPEEALLPWEACTLIGDDGTPRGEGEDGEPKEEAPTPKPEPKQPKRGKRIRYTCPGCGSKVWGKSGLSILCNCKFGPLAMLEGSDGPDTGDEDTPESF